MERRSSPRQSIHLAATLQVDGGGQWPCHLVDFCAEGIFVSYEAQHSVAIRNAIQFMGLKEVSIRFQITSSQQIHLLRVKPLRVVNEALGGSFISSNMPAMNALLESVSRADLAQPLVDHSATQMEFMLRQCFRAMKDRLKEHLDDFFDDAILQLKKSADQASSDQAANEHMDAATLLAKRKDMVSRQFLDGIEKPLNKRSDLLEPGQEDLSLIEKNEFEDWLTAKVMIASAETQYRELLLLISMRLDKAGLVNQTGYKNPLGPGLIVYSFSDALGLLNLSRRIEKVVLRVFENTVLKKIEALYDTINQILIRNNILPELDLSKFMAPQKTLPTIPLESPIIIEEKTLKSLSSDDYEQIAPPLRAQNSAIDKIKPPLSDSAGPIGKDILSGVSQSRSFVAHQKAARKAYLKLTGLFSKLGHRQTITRGPGVNSSVDSVAVPLPEASQEEMLSVIEKIKVENSQEPVEVFNAETPTLTHKVMENLSKKLPENKKIPEKQNETLDVVDRFFLSLRNSSKISDRTKAQLKQLEVPVFQSLLKDSSLFEEKDSPIRAVINRVAQLGLKGGRTSETQTCKVNMLVARVNAEAEKDPVVFDEVLAELDGLIGRQNLLYRKNVERVTSAAEGTQKVSRAKRQVQEEIDLRMAGKTVPKVVMTLINSGWRDLLSLTLIRQGDGSQLWYDYLGVLDQLLVVYENPSASVNLPVLLGLIKEGLSSISMNHMPSGHIRDELKKFLASDIPTELIAVPKESIPEAKAEMEPLKESRQRSLKRWIERAQKLSAGDWLKNLKDPDNVVFLRLVWVGDHEHRFVFVNHQGMKVIDLELMQFASWLQSGWLETAPEYGRSVVDEGLDSMVRQVYEQLSFATSHDPLTGLLNRKEFERASSDRIASLEDQQYCGMLHLDLRYFRAVNDDGSYEMGDQLLKVIAKLLWDLLPKSACIGRLGGNEFGILTKQKNIGELCQQLIDKISKVTVEKKGQCYAVGVNVGLAEISEVVNSSSALLSGAEHACRTAKEAGSNQFYWFKPPRDAQAISQKLSSKLHSIESLRSEQILLKSQKIIPLHGDSRMKAQHEILISIYDEREGLIPLKEMARTAGRFNLIKKLDRWVVAYIIEWMQNHQEQLDRLGGICINLSGHSLNDPSLAEYIFDLMSQSTAQLDKLQFDVTETSAISDMHDAVDFMLELKEIGCRFCLSNFGSDAYTYHYLKVLPVDMIRLDGTFIKDLVRDQNDQAMVKSMAEMIHFSGKELIADQVDDKTTLDFLIDVGVDYAQGSAIERPKLIVDT